MATHPVTGKPISEEEWEAFEAAWVDAFGSQSVYARRLVPLAAKHCPSMGLKPGSGAPTSLGVYLRRRLRDLPDDLGVTVGISGVDRFGTKKYRATYDESRQHRMDTVREWEKLAKAQGWRVDKTGSGHTRFWPPDPLIKAVTVSHDPQGRVLYNAKQYLRAAGLDFSASKKTRYQADTPEQWGEAFEALAQTEPLPVPDAVTTTVTTNPETEGDDMGQILQMPTREETSGDGPDLDTTASAVNALLDMVNELAEQFAAFRKSAGEQFAELRGKTMAIASTDNLVTREHVDSEILKLALDTSRELAKHTKAIERLSERVDKADPIAAFRAKLAK